jgi:hypothetical protein
MRSEFRSGPWLARALGGLAMGAMLVPGAAAAHAQPARDAEPGDSLVVYEREVFDYPSEGRRNPFEPLNTGERLGPRFGDLALTGVLFNPSVASVATLTDQKSGRRYRVREGDELGEIRIVEIRPTEVVFLITTYGVSRREVLRVKKEESEG